MPRYLGKRWRGVQVALTETCAALAAEAFRLDMASELAFLPPLDAREPEWLAGLLRKLILGIEAQASGEGVRAP